VTTPLARWVGKFRFNLPIEHPLVFSGEDRDAYRRALAVDRMPNEDFNLGCLRLGSVEGVGPEACLAQMADCIPKSHNVSVMGREKEGQGDGAGQPRAHPAKTLGSSRGQDYAQQPIMREPRQPRA
jgi:hypothetical protein